MYQKIFLNGDETYFKSFIRNQNEENHANGITVENCLKKVIQQLRKEVPELMIENMSKQDWDDIVFLKRIINLCEYRLDLREGQKQMRALEEEPKLFKRFRKKCGEVKRETVKLDCYVNVESNIDELEQKAKRLNAILKEAKTLADELASQNLEMNLKTGLVKRSEN